MSNPIQRLHLIQRPTHGVPRRSHSRLIGLGLAVALLAGCAAPTSEATADEAQRLAAAMRGRAIYDPRSRSAVIADESPVAATRRS